MNTSQSLSRFGRVSRRNGRSGRTALMSYLGVALLLLGLEAFSPQVPTLIRGYASDIVSPVLMLLEQPIRATQAGIERLAGVSDIYQENQDLRDENDRLRQWRQVSQALSRENEALRQILQAPGREVTPAATARVVGVGGGAFERSVILDAGGQDGIRRDQPAVDEAGVVGRIIYVGQLTSRLLLVTDLNSRVPVRIEGSGHLAIAEGRNDRLLRLTYLPQDVSAKVGDRILTSGHGRIFPPDIPVGEVVQVIDGVAFVEPVGLLDRLDYLKVLNYLAPPPETQPFDAPDTVPGLPQQAEGGGR